MMNNLNILIKFLKFINNFFKINKTNLNKSTLFMNINYILFNRR